MNAVEGDLLNTRRDVVQAVVEERASGVVGHRSRVCCQLEVLQLYCQAGSYINKGVIKTRTVEIEIRVFLEFILPATMASDSVSHVRAALASSSTARRAA